MAVARYAATLTALCLGAGAPAQATPFRIDTPAARVLYFEPVAVDDRDALLGVLAAAMPEAAIPFSLDAAAARMVSPGTAAIFSMEADGAVQFIGHGHAIEGPLRDLLAARVPDLAAADLAGFGRGFMITVVSAADDQPASLAVAALGPPPEAMRAEGGIELPGGAVLALPEGSAVVSEAEMAEDGLFVRQGTVSLAMPLDRAVAHFDEGLSRAALVPTIETGPLGVTVLRAGRGTDSVQLALSDGGDASGPTLLSYTVAGGE